MAPGQKAKPCFVFRDEANGLATLVGEPNTVGKAYGRDVRVGEGRLPGVNRRDGVFGAGKHGECQRQEQDALHGDRCGVQTLIPFGIRKRHRPE